MKLYIGMDIHKKFTVACAMTAKGKVFSQTRIDHGNNVWEVPWKEYFESLPSKAHVAIEASGMSYAFYEAIEPYAEQVVMAHPNKTKLIAEQKVKTDAIDANALAQLLRADMLPTAYIPPREVRDARELLRQRISLVRLQTGVKNRLHGMLTRCGYFYGQSDLFTSWGKQWLDDLPLRPVYKEEGERYWKILEFLGDEIKDLTRKIHQEVKIHPQANLLTTVPGIGPYLAMLLYWEIGDIKRFISPTKLVGYTGLGASVHSSGGKTFYGHITKEGNKYLRWGLVLAAQKYGKRKGPLGDYFRGIEHRKGSKAARIAIARKLATIIWHMLTKQEEFNESRIAEDRNRRNERQGNKRNLGLDRAALKASSR